MTNDESFGGCFLGPAQEAQHLAQQSCDTYSLVNDVESPMFTVIMVKRLEIAIGVDRLATGLVSVHGPRCC